MTAGVKGGTAALFVGQTDKEGAVFLKRYQREQVRSLDVVRCLCKRSIPWTVTPECCLVRNGFVYLLERQKTAATLWAFLHEDREKSMKYDCFLRLMEQWEQKICLALCHLHHVRPKGILHGDVSPKNILVKKNGDAFLIDFNTSDFEKSMELESPRLWFATEGFVSEQVKTRGMLSRESDFYGLRKSFYLAREIARLRRGN